MNFKLQDDQLSIDFTTENLDPQQVRLIKRINAILLSTLHTREEGEFFENSAELMRLMASVIKQANFTKPHNLPKNCSIPYAEQALEYSLDSISDEIYSQKTKTYDN